MAKLSSFLNLIISSGSLFFLSSSTSPSLNAQQNTYQIQFTNKCYDTVLIAVNYIDTDGDRITRGWFRAQTRKTRVIANTRNPVFYYYAKSQNGKIVWKGNDLYKTVEGSQTKYGFRKGTPNVSGGIVRQSLTCES